MSRTLLVLSVLGGTMFLPGARAQEKPPQDAFDLVFVHESGPVLLRIQARIGAQSVAARFEAHLKKWFDFLDVNRDGKLDAKELVGAPKAATMAQVLRGRSIGRPRLASLTLAELKKKTGETATFADFTAYYQRNNVRGLQITPTFRGSQFADLAGEVLFNLLDVNKDGKLSRAEVAAAPQLLRKFDLDDDELISAQELAPADMDGIVRARPGMTMERAPARKLAPSFGLSFYPLVNSGDRERLPDILLAHYDKDDDDKLSPKECGFDAKTFAHLDKNRDGMLDLEELAEWTKGLADFEFMLHIPERREQSEQGRMTLSLLSAGERFKASHHQASLLASLLKLGDTQIVVQARDTGPGSPPGARQDYLQQFQMADPEERGYVELADLQEPALQSLKEVFAIADRDGDGKMTEGELKAFLKLDAEGARCQAALAVIEQGPAFFQLLDANRDGRLSLHELRTAWSRLEAFDVDKKGFVTAAQLPRHFQLVVAEGPAQNLFNLGAAGLQSMGQEPARVLLPPSVPEWFRKMDTNGDGFLSPREFLGSRVDFNRIDTNGDGLIDPGEAARFDALARGKASRPSRGKQ